MRYRILLAAICLSFAAAKADENFHGPGWYVMAYQLAVIIWSGPYDSREACEAAKPADGDPPDFSYGCSHLDRDPG